MKHKEVIYSDAFYPYRHNIGISFYDIFVSDDSIKQARMLMQKRFEEAGTHKDPYGVAHIYARSFKFLKEYFDVTDGGVDAYLSGNQVLKVDNSLNGLSLEPATIPYNLTRRRKSFNIDIPKPCCENVDYYLKRWDNLINYTMQESALKKLFFEVYPTNTNIDDVLIKVSSLNDFYSTNIYYPFIMAKNIIKLKTDERLSICDELLVHDIAQITLDNKTIKNCYSFATKYCSHHKPLSYPIYDSYVDFILRYFRDVDSFSQFKNDELKNYPTFKKVLFDFQKFYNLQSYNLKDIDRYLWQLGKDMFPRK
jgi:hypothetical protein